MIVNDIIAGAMRRLGVLAATEAPQADEAADGLIALNDLLDQWALERLNIYTIVNTTFNLIPSQASYTVGTGGNVAIARPIYIDRVNYINTSFSPNQEFQLTQLTDDAWSKLSIKGLTSPLPTLWWWQSTYPLGVLYFWPVPTSATLKGSIYAPTAITQFAAGTTTVSLPPGYLRMIRSNLALELAPDYGVQPSPALVQAAQESMAAVKRANKKLMDMDIDSGALIQTVQRMSYYSIFSDG